VLRAELEVAIASIILAALTASLPFLRKASRRHRASPRRRCTRVHGLAVL